MLKITLVIILISFISISWGGEIAGTVTIQGASDNANAVVYIEKEKGMQFKPPKEEPLMNQKDLKFVPHVLPVMVGTTVRFKNSDKVAHNIFTPSPAGNMFNLGTWVGNQIKKHTFNKIGEVVLLCNLHPEMEGFIYVVPTPCFAKTDANGSYIISDVPAGSYTLKVWDENGSARPQKVEVPAEGKVTVDFKVK